MDCRRVAAHAALTAFVMLAGMAGVAAQNGALNAQGRYQQQATKSGCATQAPCVLNFDRVPNGKQVIADQFSCEEFNGSTPFFEFADDKGKVLFRLKAPKSAFFVIDSSYRISVKVDVVTNTSRLSCLITGEIKNK